MGINNLLEYLILYPQKDDLTFCNMLAHYSIKNNFCHCRIHIFTTDFIICQSSSVLLLVALIFFAGDRKYPSKNL